MPARAPVMAGGLETPFPSCRSRPSPEGVKAATLPHPMRRTVQRMRGFWTRAIWRSPSRRARRAA